MVRLLLVRHAPTAATARGAFPRDEPAAAPVAVAPGALPDGPRVLCSPARRCRDTARAAGLEPQLEPALAECDFGAWAGRTLAEVDPAGAAVWISDPDAAPHGGESLVAFCARVAQWLAGVTEDTIAFTHAGVIRAAVVAALGAPVSACWKLAPAPLAVTELQRHDAHWTLVAMNAPLAAAPAPPPAPAAA